MTMRLRKINRSRTPRLAALARKDGATHWVGGAQNWGPVQMHAYIVASAYFPPFARPTRFLVPAGFLGLLRLYHVTPPLPYLAVRSGESVLRVAFAWVSAGPCSSATVGAHHDTSSPHVAPALAPACRVRMCG